MVTCNRPAFLSLAIDATAAQDYPGNIEVIVVDDGSPPIDRTSRYFVYASPNDGTTPRAQFTSRRRLHRGEDADDTIDEDLAVPE